MRQEVCQDVFIRSIFGKRKSFNFDHLSAPSAGNVLPSVSNSVADFSQHSGGTAVDFQTTITNRDHVQQQLAEPVRIIHKDQEAISAFCLNSINTGIMSLATPRELQEMDISLLLESPNWLEDECEFDIMNLSKDVDSLASSSFLVIQANDK